MKIKIGACEVNVPEYMVDSPEHKNLFFIFLRQITAAQKSLTTTEVSAKYDKVLKKMGQSDPLGGIMEFLKRAGKQ